MNKTIIMLAALSVASVANAQLRIDVVGVPGTGITTWTFSGTGTTINTGSVRTNSANNFLSPDTGQFPFGQNTIIPPYNNQVFVFTGAVLVTAGADTRNLTGIFLDDDGGSADDLGVRVDVELPYVPGEASAWAGIGTVNVDIDDFVAGNWSLNDTDGQALDLDDEILVSFNPVPEPATMLVLGAGAAALIARRRRK